MKFSLLLSYATTFLSLTLMLPAIALAEGDDGKLRIIVFGAHPDDAQYTSSGTVAKWIKLGRHVNFAALRRWSQRQRSPCSQSPAVHRRSRPQGMAARALGQASGWRGEPLPS